MTETSNEKIGGGLQPEPPTDSLVEGVGVNAGSAAMDDEHGGTPIAEQARAGGRPELARQQSGVPEEELRPDQEAAGLAGVAGSDEPSRSTPDGSPGQDSGSVE